MADEKLPKLDGILSGAPPSKPVPTSSDDGIYAGTPPPSSQSNAIFAGVPANSPERAMGVIEFCRPSQFADSLRNYLIFVDGNCEGDIGPGSNWKIRVPEGNYELLARIDWCSSKPLLLEVQEGTLHRIEVGSNLDGWRLLLGLFYVLFFWSDYLYLREAAE